MECLSERAVAAASSLSDLERSRNLEHEKSLKNEPALSEMPLKLRFAEKKARVLGLLSARSNRTSKSDSALG